MKLTLTPTAEQLHEAETVYGAARGGFCPIYVHKGLVRVNAPAQAVTAFVNLRDHHLTEADTGENAGHPDYAAKRRARALASYELAFAICLAANLPAPSEA